MRVSLERCHRLVRPRPRLFGTDERALGLTEQVPVVVCLVGVGCDAAAQGDLDFQRFILVAQNKGICVEEGADLLGCEKGVLGAPAGEDEKEGVPAVAGYGLGARLSGENDFGDRL